MSTPQQNKTIGKSDLVMGYVEDADGLSAFTLSLDGMRVLIPIDTSSASKWTVSHLSPSVIVNSVACSAA